LRFLYKIHSGYDGFRPAVIPQRMHDGRLRLRWRHYIDVVEKGWECWVYFHGPHRFENGVYVEGIVDAIDLEASAVSLRVRKSSTTAPITSQEISRKVAEVVATPYRQVFVWPEAWRAAPKCGLDACRRRRCDDCEIWTALPLLKDGHARPPSRLRWSTYDRVIPAHWIVPRRCYETRIASAVRALTGRFTDFKLGEMGYAYPFARAMFERLRRSDRLDFDYVVPIPLSPEKANKGEKHRARALAKELGGLLAVPVREMLTLTRSVSKRRMQAVGYSAAAFERRYAEALRTEVPHDANRILLVDDVMTRGSTMAQALRALHGQRPDTKVVVATAGQMIVKDAVAEDAGFRSA